MKKSSLLLFILVPIITYSQFSVSGIVKDSSDNIEFANVIFYKPDGTIVKGAITNEKGEFVEQLNLGEYEVGISFIGYKVKKLTINVNENIYLGSILLQYESTELGEAIVIDKRPLIQRESSKLLFNVENSVMASGFMANDVIRSMPRIDPTSESIKMIGKSSITVMINDQVINLSGFELDNYLNTIKSDDIERVELIATPPAKYDASGNSGLINIVLKKNRKSGFDGSTILSYVQRTYPGIMPSANLNYSNKGLSVSYSLSADKEKKQSLTNSKITYPVSHRISENERLDDTKGINSSLRLNYALNKHINSGVFVNGSFWHTDQTTVGHTNYYGNTGALDSLKKMPSNGSNYYNFITASGFLDINIDTLGKKLKLNYNYLSKYSKDELELMSSTYENNESDYLREEKAINISEPFYNATSFNIDVTLPYNFFTIDFGGKYTLLNNDSKIAYSEVVDNS